MKETIKLTANFKLDGPKGLAEPLFSTYRSMLNELLFYAHARRITSFKRLKAEKYRELRARLPKLPSHYIYTACQMACSIYKVFRKLKRRGRVKADRPSFKKDTIMLDDHLFSLDLDSWTVSIATPRGRAKFRLLHGQYHEKFKAMRPGQAWLVKRGRELWLKVVFRTEVELREPNGRVLAIDVNENNITIASPSGFRQIRTGERPIRVAYFLKRRRIQSALKCGKLRAKLLAKYRGRGRNRTKDLYHKLANEVVRQALAEDVSVIVLEDLKGIRSHIRYGRELNGRLHRWSFRQLQTIIEYKAKLKGLRVAYVNPRNSSSLCPICGAKLSPNGYRLLRCSNCGLKANRDVIGAWNLAQRYVGTSVRPESPAMKLPDGSGVGKSHMGIKVPNVHAGQNGLVEHLLCKVERQDRKRCTRIHKELADVFLPAPYGGLDDYMPHSSPVPS